MSTVVAHYEKQAGDSALIERITAGVTKMGKSFEGDTKITVDELAPVDEYHIGGRMATMYNIEKMGGFTADDVVLDVGCGNGGSCRLYGKTAGSVVGVDLTPDYIKAGEVINEKLGLTNIKLQVGDAVALPYEGKFTKAMVHHVGMNIEDKGALAKSIAKTLKPGGKVMVFDILKTGDGVIPYPMPWSGDDGKESFVSTVDEYKAVFTGAGLTVEYEEKREEFAVGFFEKAFSMMKKVQEETGAPPPLGLHLYMGPSAPVKLKNAQTAILEKNLCPYVLIFTKPMASSSGP